MAEHIIDTNLIEEIRHGLRASNDMLRDYSYQLRMAGKNQEANRIDYQRFSNAEYREALQEVAREDARLSVEAAR